LTEKGFREVVSIRAKMNRGGKRTNLKSPETICQTRLDGEKI